MEVTIRRTKSKTRRYTVPSGYSGINEEPLEETGLEGGLTPDERGFGSGIGEFNSCDVRGGVLDGTRGGSLTLFWTRRRVPDVRFPETLDSVTDTSE